MCAVFPYIAIPITASDPKSQEICFEEHNSFSSNHDYGNFKEASICTVR